MSSTNEEELNKKCAEQEGVKLKEKNSKEIERPYNQTLNILSLYTKKIAGGIRLKIEDKIKIIELHKNDPINFSIYKLSDILCINRSTISRWVDNKIKLL